jgi:Ferric iron reductase FhuF-like transporter/FhuF 2Fe-2S C-terminal domain
VLDDLTALGPFFAVSAHPRGAEPAPPWRRASELTCPSGPLRDRVASVRAALAAREGRAAGDVEPRVAASAVHLGLMARLASPALGAAVLGHRVDMRPGHLWWQDVTGGPVPLSVPAPGANGEHGTPLLGRGHGQLPGEWDRLLFDELLAPVTAAVARLVPVSGRVLWGNVASAVNAAAAQVARQRPDLAGGAWRAAGRLFGSPWLRGEPQPPGPAFRRSSCCLFYRLAPGNPSAVCGDCVLAGRAGSSARLSRTTAAYRSPHRICRPSGERLAKNRRGSGVSRSRSG